MQTQELPAGVFDLNITFRKDDYPIFKNSGFLAKFHVVHDFDDDEYGQPITVCSLEEANIDEVVLKLIELNLETDIEMLPFFYGDKVDTNAYTRITDEGTKSFTNLKTSEFAALQMSKLLYTLIKQGITNAQEITMAEINKFHSIGFIANPLNQP